MNDSSEWYWFWTFSGGWSDPHPNAYFDIATAKTAADEWLMNHDYILKPEIKKIVEHWKYVDGNLVCRCGIDGPVVTWQLLRVEQNVGNTFSLTLDGLAIDNAVYPTETAAKSAADTWLANNNYVTVISLVEADYDVLSNVLDIIKEQGSSTVQSITYKCHYCSEVVKVALRKLINHGMIRTISPGLFQL